jgi:uncharacterized protein YigE (DUF2233 family)
MRRFFLLLGLVAICWWSLGVYRARGDSTWTNVGAGIESRTFSWHGARVYAYRALPSHIGMGSSAYLEAPEWIKKTKAHVVINGGYFDGDGNPMGLRVSQNKRLMGLRNANWGVFWIKQGHAHIEHTRDFSTSTRPEFAIQCGPRLVVDGKTTDLKQQWDRRTGLGIDRRGRVVLAIADGQLSLDEWAQIFASSEGLGCRDALNLDGGGSTQLAFNSGKKHLDIGGSWPVPDVVVIK